MSAGGKGLPEEVRAVSHDTVLTKPLNFFKKKSILCIKASGPRGDSEWSWSVCSRRVFLRGVDKSPQHLAWRPQTASKRVAFASGR